MTREEQKQILALIDRAVGKESCAVASPMDIEADAIIRALFVRNPEAAYRVTMLAVHQAREIEALQDKLPIGAPAPARKIFGRLFPKRASQTASIERHIGALEQPING